MTEHEAGGRAISGETHHVLADRVHKTYGQGAEGVEAIRSASFAVENGEFVSFLGPSGCGKSTLLMMICGLIPHTPRSPTPGRLEVNGVPVTCPRPDTGVVFQTPVLLPWRSVLDNVLFPIETLGLNRRDYLERAHQLLSKTGLLDFKHKLPRQLSGGMQQRVAICRALIYDPNLLLMDEPFSALDALTRDEMNIELLRIWEEHRKTVIFVTHSIREAVFLSDRVLVMSGRPATIMDQVRVELPRPRAIELQETAEFNRYVRLLRELINRSHALDRGELRVPTE